MLCLYTCTPGLICTLLLGASEAGKKFCETEYWVADALQSGSEQEYWNYYEKLSIWTIFLNQFSQYVLFVEKAVNNTVVAAVAFIAAC